MSKESNLEKGINPCCGYVSDSADTLPDFETVIPERGDMAICLNCGTILVYLDGLHNKTRTATRHDIDGLTKEDRRVLKTMQRHIFKRGWIKGMRAGN